MGRDKSLTEKLALAMAARAEGLTSEGRPHYMIGVMGSCAEELERVLGLIASGKVHATEARQLAKNALGALDARCYAKAGA